MRNLAVDFENDLSNPWRAKPLAFLCEKSEVGGRIEGSEIAAEFETVDNDRLWLQQAYVFRPEIAVGFDYSSLLSSLME